MGDIRKKYDAALKAKIALEAVKGDKTIREISSAYGVHSNQITIFSDKRAKTEKDKEELEAELYRQIGQLKVELEWLKKNLLSLSGGKA